MLSLVQGEEQRHRRQARNRQRHTQDAPAGKGAQPAAPSRPSPAAPKCRPAPTPPSVSWSEHRMSAGGAGRAGQGRARGQVVCLSWRLRRPHPLGPLTEHLAGAALLAQETISMLPRWFLSLFARRPPPAAHLCHSSGSHSGGSSSCTGAEAECAAPEGSRGPVAARDHARGTQAGSPTGCSQHVSQARFAPLLLDAVDVHRALVYVLRRGPAGNGRSWMAQQEQHATRGAGKIPDAMRANCTLQP